MPNPGRGLTADPESGSQGGSGVHHKRGRPKSTRAGCLLCKPYKDQKCPKHKRLKFSDQRRADAARRMVCEEVRGA